MVVVNHDGLYLDRPLYLGHLIIFDNDKGCDDDDGDDYDGTNLLD